MNDEWLNDFFWTESRTVPTEFNLSVRDLVIKLFNKFASEKNLPLQAFAPNNIDCRNRCVIVINSENDVLDIYDIYNDAYIWDVLSFIFEMDFKKYIRVETTVDVDYAMENFDDYLYRN